MMKEMKHYLMKMDEQKFLSFGNLETMNGKKREPMDIKGKFYVETLMNSNALRRGERKYDDGGEMGRYSSSFF
jgi:hypothetical protein